MKKLDYVDSKKELQIIKVKDHEATRSTFTKTFAEELDEFAVDETSYLSLLTFIKSKKIYDGESIKYLLDFIKTFPTITRDGIDEITSLYIKEIFKEKEIVDKIASLKEKGIDSTHFSKLLLELEKYYILYIKCLKRDLVRTDLLLSEYPHEYVMAIKDFMQSEKVLLDKIIQYIPSRSLVEQDVGHQYQLTHYYRIDFGVRALSTIVAIKAAVYEGKSIDETTFDKMEWTYHIHFDSFDEDIPLSYTKEEYVASVQKEKIKTFTH